MAKSLMALAVAALIPFAPLAAQNSPAAESQTLDEVEREVDRAESIEAIKRITYMFSYYRDAHQYERALALFDDAARYDFANGQYVGKASIRRLFDSKRFAVAGRVPGSDGPPILNNHIMMQPAITLAADGRTAKARFKDLVFEAEHGKSQTYSIGAYENDYVRGEGGRWFISAVRYCYRFHAPYDMAARAIPVPPKSEAIPATYPKDPEGPDRQINYYCHVYPDVGVNPPFHFNHPVTGEHIAKP